MIRLFNFYIFKFLERITKAIKPRYSDEFSAIRIIKKYFLLVKQKENYQVILNNDLIINLRSTTSDLKVFKQIYINKEYEPLVKLICQKEINISQIVDLGANIGIASLYLVNTFPGSNLICLEPDKSNFEILRKNIPRSWNSQLLNKAIWSSTQKLTVNNDFRDKMEWSRTTKLLGGSGFNNNDLAIVDGISIDDLMATNRINSIDILKIDIEGSEKELFNSTSIKDVLKITKFISIEIHDELDCRQNIYSILTECGFKLIERGELTLGYNSNL